MHFFFLKFYWCYNSLWVLAFSAILLHSFLSLLNFSTLLFLKPGCLLQYLPTVVFMFPACRTVRTFQVPKRITLFFSLLRNLRHFRKDSPVSITEFFAIFVFFFRGRVVGPAPNPQPGGPGYPFLSGSSPLTCLAWKALPVAYATASIALGFMWPRKPHRYVKVGIPSGGGGHNALALAFLLRAIEVWTLRKKG
jgi:hypothetical protein